MAMKTRFGQRISLKKALSRCITCIRGAKIAIEGLSEKLASYLDRMPVSIGQCPFNFSTFSITSLAHPKPPLRLEV